jgi:hypothetical protein
MSQPFRTIWVCTIFVGDPLGDVQTVQYRRPSGRCPIIRRNPLCYVCIVYGLGNDPLAEDSLSNVLTVLETLWVLALLCKRPYPENIWRPFGHLRKNCGQYPRVFRKTSKTLESMPRGCSGPVDIGQYLRVSKTSYAK